MASITIKGSDYGISANFELEVDEIVNGQGTDKYPNRSPEEKQLHETIILQFQQQENLQQKNI